MSYVGRGRLLIFKPVQENIALGLNLMATFILFDDESLTMLSFYWTANPWFFCLPSCEVTDSSPVLFNALHFCDLLARFCW